MVKKSGGAIIMVVSTITILKGITNKVCSYNRTELVIC